MPFSAKIGFYQDQAVAPAPGFPTWPTEPTWTEISDEMSNWSNTSAPSGFTASYSLTYDGTNKWRGAVNHPNGNVYFVPRDATSIIEFDPTANIADNKTFGHTFSVNSGAYHGAVLGDNGNVYCIPFLETAVLEFDPVAGTSQEINVGYAPRLSAGIKASNGKIYCVPQQTTNSANILVIDPSNSAVSVSSMQIAGGAQNSTNRYSGGTRGPDDRLYFAPMAVGTVCVIDSSNDTLVETDYGHTITGSTNRYLGAATASNGKVIFAPFNAGNVMMLDTTSNNLSQPFTIPGSHIGAVTGSDGNVHCVPWNNNEYIKYDATANTAASINAGLSTYKGYGSVLDKTGNIVIAPDSTYSEMAVVDIFGTGWTDADTANSAFLSPWINKGTH